MPKISAATVAEHHNAQRRALLDAARALLTEAPDRAPGLADVAARAGLARSSAYNYFRSRQDLLAAVVEDMFPRWNERVSAAMAAAGTPQARVLAYVDANIALVVEGEHAVVGALTRLEPDAVSRERMAALHGELAEPLTAALRDGGSANPRAAAALVNAVVHSATVLLESGEPPATVRAAVRETLAYA
ncbi:TetR/AcrR family transcriptional regulator [Rhodococcus rhodnii]|uniref:HTH tetR-type domain-containing protein n=2 Tax=Rhodococcus rhodnii TaxID=38312 RepID=R7WN71_9NOCA|nr:TetR/AcrR family transcriptional regulator [Rhodococcus rhodnii]EOM76766.1 hypothetical protein Rrhod_1886 [Rhodococcus rhodnii LMG 5362]TXG90052.1 TetR/AcrR family transcriptional regulator [Rhodococcus rhodnii]